MWNLHKAWLVLTVAALAALAFFVGANAAFAGEPGDQKQFDADGADGDLDDEGTGAEEEQRVQVETPPEDEQAETLIYSVNRIPERLFDTPRAAQVVTIEQIWRRNARTLPEVLMQETGIFMQQTNYGGGSPIIRGMMGKQIQILVDGVKVNTATYRFGPVQYLSTIDLNIVERVEVVRGVGSVQYGSDALGGVINVITKKGPPPGTDQKLGVNVQSRFSTADSAGTGRVEAFGRGEKFRYLGGVMYRSTEDLTGGGDISTQAGTGYDERAGNFNLEYYPSFDKTVTVSYMDMKQNEVPRTDRIQNGNNLVFDFDPQRLRLLQASYQDTTDRKWSNLLRLTAFWNAQEEGRNEIRSSAPDVERKLYDDQTMLGFNVELASMIGQSNRLVYGLDFSTEEITSLRDDVNILTGEIKPKRGQYTDGATYDTFGLYVQDRFDIGQQLTLTIGGRFSRFAIGGSEDSTLGVLELDSVNQAATGSASAVYQLTRGLNLIGSVTSGFRAPNIDDVSILDPRNNGTEIPNPEVGPERIANYEGGVKFSNARLSGSAFYYHSQLTDLLLRSDGTFNGLPFFDLDGDGIQDASEVAVLQKQNIGEATIDGIELDSSYVLHPGYHLFANFTWTVGDDTVKDVPLRRIPPVFGTAGFRWSPRTVHRPWAEIIYQFAGSQTRLNPSDISDSRIGPDGTEAFNVFHVRGGLTFAEVFRFSVAIENVFDEPYKYHSSGVFRPGRQLVLGFELRF